MSAELLLHLQTILANERCARCNKLYREHASEDHYFIGDLDDEQGESIA